MYPCMCVFSVARNWLIGHFLTNHIIYPKSIMVGPNLSIGNQSKTLADKLLTFIYTTSLCTFCVFPCMCVYMYVHICVHACVRVRVRVCVCVCVFILLVTT